MQNIYEVQAANKRKSFLVIVFFIIFVSLAIYVISIAMGEYLGYKPGGLGIAGLALIISGFISLGSYYFSDKIILSISKARPADRKQDFQFYTVAENLSLGAGIPKPSLYVIEDSAPNAFATGRDPDHSVIAVTTGLLQKLERTELEGVVAHEISHIKNFDTRLMTIVVVMVGSVALLGDFFLRMTWFGGGGRNDRKGNAGVIFLILGLLFAILAPIVANLIKLAISRRREFMADAGSVAITRQPSGLISALRKIASDHEPLKTASKATAHLYIENPFKDKTGSKVGMFSNLFNTHPPIKERIETLNRML
jgi:heat shock protein HtpX